MPRYDLDGQVAIVTGAGRGIGRAIALRLAQEGCLVTVADLDGGTAAQVAAEIRELGGQALAHQVDVTRKEEVEGMVRQTCDQLGSLRILVNNAGIGAIAPLLETDEETWDALMNVNAKSVLLCSQAAARQMIEQGEAAASSTTLRGLAKSRPAKICLWGPMPPANMPLLRLPSRWGWSFPTTASW